MSSAPPQIAPSLLSADFAHLARDIQIVEVAGADLLHIDVMDGHFVPNLTFGTPILEAIHRVSKLPMDVHLMVENPDPFVDWFARFNISMISVHFETCPHLHRTLQHISERGMRAGIAINPATSLSSIEESLPFADFVLIMSVNPGFSGQKIIEAPSLDKVKRLRELCRQKSLPTLIEVDGGISSSNIGKFAEAGADIFVAGSAIFAADHPQEIVKQMRVTLEKTHPYYKKG